MSEVESDRKRRAPEMDPATVVVPKKKFLAAQAEAAASEPSATAAKLPPSPSGTGIHTNTALGAEGRQTAGPSTVHATSYSVRDNAPAGARSADDDENVRFQNSQLYAANQAYKHEVGRLSSKIEGLEQQHRTNLEKIAVVQRHWKLLTDELKNSVERLGPSEDVDPKNFKSLEIEFTASDPEKDAELIGACQKAQDVMKRLVFTVQSCKEHYKQCLDTLQSKDLADSVKSELGRLARLNRELEDGRNVLEERLRFISMQETFHVEEVKRLTASVTALRQENADLKSSLETTERRLFRSEENYRKLSAGGFSSQRSISGTERVKIEPSSSSGAADGGEREGFDTWDMRATDYKMLADSRLEEIKERDKRILLLETQTPVPLVDGQEMNEPQILQSAPYLNLQDQLNRAKKDYEYLAHRFQMTILDLNEMKERMLEERQKLELQNSIHIKEQFSRVSQLSTQLVDAKQEIRSLQFKLEQKNACDITSKRADELSANLAKLQEEYKRLREENEMLKQKPDAEELRRDFREREEKIAKERDVKQIEANDYLDQIRMQERKIAMLMGRNGEPGAHGANGNDVPAQREIDALKKDVENLRNERKDLQRRFMKADRGFNDCNKLYQQVKREKDALMKDLESLGTSFEEMQEQNVRLLQQMKAKDEEQHNLLKQKMKDKQYRELKEAEITTLKLKLEKAEELLRIKEDCVDKCKIDMEQQRQDFLRKKKEEECEATLLGAHRANLQKKEQAVAEAKREAEKIRCELAEHQKKKRETIQALQDAQFENSRLQEEISTLKSRLLHSQAPDKKPSSVSADHMELLDHYRSRVKCHCRQDDKARVFPCGHATCVKCCEGLIRERSRKCPACSKKFDQSEIRPLYLQGSSDET